MLIPTAVESWAELAVPDPSYWCETAAQYVSSPTAVSSPQLIALQLLHQSSWSQLRYGLCMGNQREPMG